MRPLLALLLTGCAGYTWIPDGQVTGHYRWIVVAPSAFPALCGFNTSTGYQRGAACAIRLKAGVTVPTDQRVPGTNEGGLCVIFSTMSEDEAKRVRDWDGGTDLFSHELKHCQGWGHTGGPK